jgi:hypothetical protein
MRPQAALVACGSRNSEYFDHLRISDGDGSSSPLGNLLRHTDGKLVIRNVKHDDGSSSHRVRNGNDNGARS